MSNHEVTVITQANHGTKARRYRCTCGDLGPRVAYGPGVRTLAQADERVMATAARYGHA